MLKNNFQKKLFQAFESRIPQSFFAFGTLSMAKVYGENWIIKSPFMTLKGYGQHRLNGGKYSNGLFARLDRLSRHYGYGVEWKISKNDLVVDIGANIGEFSLFCLRKGARVLSVEPDPVILKCTKKNVSKYKRSVGVEESVVSNSDGCVEFYQAPSSADSSIIKPDSYDQKLSLNSITLDSLYEKYDLRMVHLVKCDAEGAEPEVFANASKALAKTKVVTVNCGPERYGQDTVSEVSDILRNHGFEY